MVPRGLLNGRQGLEMGQIPGYWALPTTYSSSYSVRRGGDSEEWENGMENSGKNRGHSCCCPAEQRPTAMPTFMPIMILNPQ